MNGKTSFAATLSKSAEFFDVDGIPVSLGEPTSGLYSAAWDTLPPRDFNPDSARRNGAPVSADAFARLVSDINKGHEQNGIDKLLHTSTHRLLFILASLCLLPWFLMHPVRELWYRSNVADYLYSAFVDPFAPWFKSGWWQFTFLEWYDWLVLPSLVFYFLALTWPYTGMRLIKWVRNE